MKKLATREEKQIAKKKQNLEIAVAFTSNGLKMLSQIATGRPRLKNEAEIKKYSDALKEELLKEIQNHKQKSKEDKTALKKEPSGRDKKPLLYDHTLVFVCPALEQKHQGQTYFRRFGKDAVILYVKPTSIKGDPDTPPSEIMSKFYWEAFEQYEDSLCEQYRLAEKAYYEALEECKEAKKQYEKASDDDSEQYKDAENRYKKALDLFEKPLRTRLNLAKSLKEEGDRYKGELERLEAQWKTAEKQFEELADVENRWSYERHIIVKKSKASGTTTAKSPRKKNLN